MLAHSNFQIQKQAKSPVFFSPSIFQILKPLFQNTLKKLTPKSTLTPPMDPHPTPFPGKNQPLKSKPNQETTGPSKTISREHVTYREKPAFGTVRNANIPSRTVFEKPAVGKSSIGVARKQTEKTRKSRNEAARKENWPQNTKPEWKPPTRVPVTEAAKKENFPEHRKPEWKQPTRVPVTEVVKENFPENPKPEWKQPTQVLVTEAAKENVPPKPEPESKQSARVPVTGTVKENFHENLKPEPMQPALVPVSEAAGKEDFPERMKPQPKHPTQVPLPEAAKNEKFSENPKPQSKQPDQVLVSEATKKKNFPENTKPESKQPAQVPVPKPAKEENLPENPKPESIQPARVIVSEAAKTENFPEKLKPDSKQPTRVPASQAVKKESAPENPKPKSKQRAQVPATEAAKVENSPQNLKHESKQPARVPVTKAAKKEKSPENPKTKLKQKRVSIHEEVGEKTPIIKLKTPVTASPSLSQCKTAAGSAYQSAKICSKCRFDKLETSAYWLAQVKLSESVGKHFLSAAFFKLAFESKAEPIGKLCCELKTYLARNWQLAEQTKWKKVCIVYGLLKDEKETKEIFDHSAIPRSDAPDQTTNVEPDLELPEAGPPTSSCIL